MLYNYDRKERLLEEKLLMVIIGLLNTLSDYVY